MPTARPYRRPPPWRYPRACSAGRHGRLTPWTSTSPRRGEVDQLAAPSACARLTWHQCAGLDLDFGFAFHERTHLDHGHRREMPAHDATIGIADLRQP